MNRVSQEEFLRRAAEIWGSRWDYSLTKYKGTHLKVEVICRTHGSFLQSAKTHLKGRVGCARCRGEVDSTASFIEEASKVWGDRWDYSQTKYVNSTQHVTIGCREHGPFTQSPSNHKAGGVGCKSCSGQYKKTSEDFIAEAKEVWGDRWDYQDVEYLRANDKVQIGCREHGPFQQNAASHLRGKVGCLPCRSKVVDLESFISAAKEVWGDRWDYSNTLFKGADNVVEITCPSHGAFSQPARNHIKGHVGCPECSGHGLEPSKRLHKAAEIWEGRWNYPPQPDIRVRENILAVCEYHGEFYQPYETHMKKMVGCRSCLGSGGEDELYAFISSILPEKELQRGRRDLLGNSSEIDIFIPSLKIGVEFNGVYYHSEKFKDPQYHSRKTRRAESAGFRLLHIWEDDWNSKKSIVEEHLRQVMGVSSLPRVSARDCEVITLRSPEARTFLDRYHIQGFSPSSVYLGLQNGGNLEAVASFKRSGEDTFYLTRYATSSIVRGGHSKIVSYFERNFNYKKLITFADLSYSDGGLYRKTGWVEESILGPDYQYLVNGVRQHKFNYRLKRFKDDPTLKYISGYSESELAKLNNILRVYDAGKIKFIREGKVDG